ncbi:MAG TPA: metallophosphoesterase [Bryobacteraceae bacterium]
MKKKVSKAKHPKATQVPNPPPPDNGSPIPTGGPQFAQPGATPDPTKFVLKHGSDSGAYKILDAQKQNPRPFPIVKGRDEPIVKLEEAFGKTGAQAVAAIQRAGQIVFHAAGDTGNTRGPRDQDVVADKMVSDFNEVDPETVPSFLYHLGDVIYSFGESEYYYDQFYDTYRSYPAPIFAIAGNHDGMVAPKSTATSLQAFLENFCQAGQPPHRTPETGELLRTAQIQPGVYFTLEAPFVRVIGLYSNCLEDPGVISTQGGQYPYLTDVQVTFLQTALARIKKQKFAGAVLIAVHHPPYVAVNPNNKEAGNHGSSPLVLKDIDAACAATGVWPHAVLSGHAHNYQRFTRSKDGRQTPFLVAGNGGHGITALTKKSQPTIRVPVDQSSLSDGTDQITFDSYDDQDFGYLRIVVDPKQLRIEYHPATDGQASKSPDDSVTVDLVKRQIVKYQVLR